jgi:hypothetical protein
LRQCSKVVKCVTRTEQRANKRARGNRMTTLRKQQQQRWREKGVKKFFFSSSQNTNGSNSSGKVEEGQKVLLLLRLLSFSCVLLCFGLSCDKETELFSPLNAVNYPCRRHRFTPHSPSLQQNVKFPSRLEWEVRCLRAQKRHKRVHL